MLCNRVLQLCFAFVFCNRALHLCVAYVFCNCGLQIQEVLAVVKAQEILTLVKIQDHQVQANRVPIAVQASNHKLPIVEDSKPPISDSEKSHHRNGATSTEVGQALVDGPVGEIVPKKLAEG